MSNHIDLLFDFFHQYVNIGIKENIFNEFNKLLKDYVGRPTPLYFAKRLSEKP